MKTRYLISITLLFLQIFLYAQQGKIKGRVIDANTNEPLSFANIVIDGKYIGSTTDLDGNFLFAGMEPGYIKLRASFIGYKAKLTEDILLTNNTVPFIEIKLEPMQENIKEVTVFVDRFEKRIEAPVSMQSIGLREIESNPGSNRDISRVIQSFPGIGSTPNFRNDIIVRGGGPSESRFFLDEVEIPVLNHFSTQGASGGPVGIINADFIQSVDYFSGSFPANRYNAMSGIFEFRQKNGSMEKTNLQAALGASESSLTLDGPMGKKTSYIFSVRRSYLQFLFSALELPFLPTFNDYQLKVKSSINTKNEITIVSIGSLDNLALNTDIKDPDESQEYILTQIPVNNQWSYTFGTVYKHFGTAGYHTLVYSRNMLNNEFYKYPDNDESLERSLDYLSRETENKFRYEYTFRKEGIKYNISSNLENAAYENSTSQKVLVNNELLSINYNSDFQLVKIGISAQASKKFMDNRLLLSAGFRFDGNNYNDEMTNIINQFSPRFSFSFSAFEKLSIIGGIGRYYQLPAYTTLGYKSNEGEFLNKDIAEYIGVNHYNFGFESRPSKNIILSVEAFYKQYFQYPIDTITGTSLANFGAGYSSVVGAGPVVFSGEGKAVGFEILGRLNYNKFNLIASYTFVRSEFTDIENEYIPSSWDSKHLLTITGTKEFKNNWQAGFKWRFVGGLPYTPYDMENSAIVSAWNANGQAYFDYSQLNSLRFDAFHQLDIRVDKNFFFNNWTMMLYFDIQNLYNFQNTGQDYVVREKNEDGSYKLTDNGTKYLLQRIENISGTVLPTIGIMIKI